MALFEECLYVVAMLMFASLPVQALVRGFGRKGIQLVREPEDLTPKHTAIVAFLLLWWLQWRNQYRTGLALVTLNLGLRVLEILWPRAAANWGQRRGMGYEVREV